MKRGGDMKHGKTAKNVRVQSYGRRVLLALLAAGLLMISAVAHATPLNLVLQPTPDLLSDFISITYNAFTDNFTAHGFSEKLNGGALFPTGFFDILATIDSGGNASAGSLSITGVAGSNASPLLTATTLDAFGFNSSGTLEFLFSGLGGSLASQYGSLAGVILSGTGWAPPIFSSDFTEDGLAQSDTGSPVPEPATLLMLGSGMGMLYGVGMLRNRRRHFGNV